MSWRDRLDRVTARSAELAARLSEPNLDASEYTSLSREYADIAEIVQRIDAFRTAEGEVADLETLLADTGSDAEIRELARDELEAAREALSDREKDLQIQLLPKDPTDARNVILEIRAGTGGDEAGLFAADLFRMYQRHAQIHGWKLEIVDASDSDVGGFNQITANIGGRDVFGRLKFESGTHRVQRVPVTESGGRIHTSAATVAILPEAEEVDIEVDEKDLRIDTYRSQGAGGQHVNTTDSAVRITHLPTGIVVQCQDEKSQHKNRAKAMTVLRARLFDAERERQATERAADRKGQIGSGDRSERIRTYNFPQGRVTDHRINLTLYKLDKVIAGESLDEIIDSLLIEEQTSKLTALSESTT